jgi:hypothetical protein
MLTDAAIRRLKPRDKAFKAADMHGLYLLVRPDGARYWRMDFRHAGRRGTLSLGVYPRVSLKEARQKRESARKLLDKGVNPSTYKKLTRGVAKILQELAVRIDVTGYLRVIEAKHRATPTGMGYGATRFSSPTDSFTLLYAAQDLPTALAEKVIRGRFQGKKRRVLLEEDIEEQVVSWPRSHP